MENRHREQTYRHGESRGEGEMYGVTWKLTFILVQLLSHVSLLAIQWTAAPQAFLYIANSWNLLKLMFVESVMPPNHLILCHPLLFLSQSFPVSGSFQGVGSSHQVGQNIGASSLVFIMNIQEWLPLGLTGLISLLSKGLSSTTIWKHQFFSTQPFLWSNSHIHTWLLEKP